MQHEGNRFFAPLPVAVVGLDDARQAVHAEHAARSASLVVDVDTARGFAADASHAIKEEYSYNVSQQIYVSTQLWTLVKAIKEQHLQLFQNITASLPQDASAADLSQKLIEYLQSMEIQPQDRGLEFMKQEIALTLGQ